MAEWEPGQGWQSWMEELDLMRWVPRPVFARPTGLASLGSESYVIEPYIIRAPHRVHIGDNVTIAARAFLSVIESHNNVKYEPVLRIGNNVSIGSDAFIGCAGGVEIGDRTGLSVRVYIGDTAREYEDPNQPPKEMSINEAPPVRIGADVMIGVGAIVLAGVTVGDRAFIGAGSVVTRNVPPRSVVFGNPARVIRTWDESAGKWRMGR